MTVYLRRAWGTGLAVVAFLALAGSAAAAPTTSADGGSPSLLAGAETPTVSMVFHNSRHNVVTTVEVGFAAHAYVTVTGAAGTPTGGVYVEFFDNASCGGTWQASSWLMALENGHLDAVEDQISFSTAGTYSFKARYMGDDVYATAYSPCKALTFTKANPVVVLRLHDGDHDVVDALPYTELVHAFVDVNGRVGTPSGYVLLRAWGNASCSGDYWYGTHQMDAAGEAHFTQDFAFGVPSSWSFKARYSGNATYNPKWSDCIAVKGERLTPSLVMELHDLQDQPAPASVLVGDPIHTAFKLTATGNKPASGTVKAVLFNGADCNVQIGASMTPAVPYYDVDTFGLQARAFPSVGSWRLQYSGNTYYKPVTTPCQSVRWRAVPKVALTVHDGDHDAVTSALAGTDLHLRASVSGEFGTATGQVNLKVHENGTCSSAEALGSGQLNGGVLHKAGLTYDAGDAGKISFQAVYKGDGTYAGAKSACLAVTLTEPVAAPKATATPAPAATKQPVTTVAPSPTAAAETPAASASASASTELLPTAGPTAAPTLAPAMALEPTIGPAPSSAPATAGPDAPGGAGPAGPIVGSPIGDAGSIWLVLVIVLLLGLGPVLWFAVLGRQRRRPAAAGAAES